MDGTSSPDPLSNSLTYSSPVKTRGTSRANTRKSLPLRGGSPKKQTFQLELGSDLSPQKIKVTVEAGNSDDENLYYSENGPSSPSRPSRAPTNRRGERTFTTTVPVKGLSDTEADSIAHYGTTPRRARGRPRKSGTPVATKKRSSTPKGKSPGKRRSVGDLIDGDDEQDLDFRISQSVEIGRGKGKSRSRSRGLSRKSKDQIDKPDDYVPKKRGRPRKSLPGRDPISVDNEDKTNRHEGEVIQNVQLGSRASDWEQTPSTFSPIRSNATPGESDQTSDVVIARFDPGNETPRRAGWSSPRIVDSEKLPTTRHRADSYPSPIASPAKSKFGNDRQIYDEDLDQEDVQYMEAEEDDGGEMREFDTILESEGFSMISVDSVHSLREHISSPIEQPERPAPKSILNHHLLALQQENAVDHNDSFSSIPEDVLEAASPVRKTHHANMSRVQTTQMNSSLSTKQLDTPSEAMPAKPEQRNRPLEATQAYEDSFSAIPPTLLKATTPAAVRKVYPTSESLSIPGQSGLPSSRRVISPRLLTPEETPSPPHEHNVEDSGENRKLAPAALAELNVELPANSVAQMRSSPPSVAPRRYTYTEHLRNYRQLHPDMTQTPSIVFSSPTLPPPLQMGREQDGLRPKYDESERPTLSPIARAGRMLQDVVVPSSPRSRSQSLGSPFKSPGADKRSPSVIPVPESVAMQDRLAGPLPRLDLSSQFSEPSSHRFQKLSSAQEDPFQNDTIQKERSPSPEQHQPYKLELPHQRQTLDLRSTSTRSDLDHLSLNDDMSWQAEEPSILYSKPKSTNIDPLSNFGRYPLETETSRANFVALTNEQRWEAGREEVKKQISSAAAEKIIVIDSSDEGTNVDQADDEDFGLLLETLNSSSPAVPQNQRTKDLVEKPRRSKLPSPWRQNSKRLVYSDEISHLSSPPSLQVGHEFSRDSNIQPITERRMGTRAASEDFVANLSGWQIPQKSNFNPRKRETGHLDLSALLSASPAKQLPVLARSSQLLVMRGDMNSTDTLCSVDSRESSSYTTTQSARAGFTPIPQKMGFNPRPTSPAKQAQPMANVLTMPSHSGAVAYPELNSSPPRLAQPFASSSPSRTNTLPAHHKPSEIFTSSPVVETPNSIRSSQISPNQNENQDLNPRTLDWAKSLRLATIAASSVVIPPLQPPSSPTKSCLRSPLKTPSTQTGPGFPDVNLSPSKAVAFVSSSPAPSSPPVVTLSSTTWSKSHWQLLDEIADSWKPISTSPSTDSSTKRRRNSTRVISRLLGKTVRSQGESMVFEQWHLEAVDEFRGAVPGWQERVVAMRLFSLILAADRRARGVGGGRCY